VLAERAVARVGVSLRSGTAVTPDLVDAMVGDRFKTASPSLLNSCSHFRIDPFDHQGTVGRSRQRRLSIAAKLSSPSLVNSSAVPIGDGLPAQSCLFIVLNCSKYAQTYSARTAKRAGCARVLNSSIDGSK
jgi:hypothetical protein